MMRRTKIVATLGPASESLEVLRQMIDAGVNVVRCNFSHGTPEDHAKRVNLIRQAAKDAQVCVGILADLQGPKIRIAKFKEGPVTLKDGDLFVLDARLEKTAGTKEMVGIDYADLPNDVKSGDHLLLGDGDIELEVETVKGAQIHCRVVLGGVLSNNKGINKIGGGLSAKALTDKDKQDIKTAAALGVDYVAVSFPRDQSDMYEARALLSAANSNAGLVAKIERVEAVAHIDDIINASEAVMVARGDLAVEIGDAEVPGVQKHIIQRARALDKMVITATQMMESMVKHPLPTRAEVSDVANAVLDGTDAVMLSAETAVGAYPVKVIQAMDRVCRAAERQASTRVSRHRVECFFNRMDEGISMAAMYLANHMDVKAIIALTESGSTPLWMSRIHSHHPIFALTRHVETQGKMSLCRGVIPVEFDSTKIPIQQVNTLAIAELLKRGVIKIGDQVLITSGDHMGFHGGTNQLKVMRVS